METLQTIIDEFNKKGFFLIKQAKIFTEKCLNNQVEYDYSDDDSDSSQSSKTDAYDLVKLIISNSSEGNYDDYHDYAVAFAMADEYTYACKVLLLGLKKFSTNIDLLSSFLYYAIKSSEDEHYKFCAEIQDRLKARRSFWNWRAYDFSIEYLLDKLERGNGNAEELKIECLNLTLEFQANIPENELGYVEEARIYSIFRDERKEIVAYEKAFKRKNILIGRTGTALSQIYIKQKKYNKAMKCVERVIKDIPKLNSISPMPAWMLLIRCKVIKLLSKWKVSSNIDTKQNVDTSLAKEIVRDWEKVKYRSNPTKQVYKDTDALVKFVEIISNDEWGNEDNLEEE